MRRRARYLAPISDHMRTVLWAIHQRRDPFMGITGHLQKLHMQRTIDALMRRCLVVELSANVGVNKYVLTDSGRAEVCKLRGGD